MVTVRVLEPEPPEIDFGLKVPVGPLGEETTDKATVPVYPFSGEMLTV